MSNLDTHKYYVYRHIRLDSNTPFYVGKGSGNRAFRKLSQRNKYWNNIANKHGYEVEIIMDGLTEDQAYLKELEFIELYKKEGYCEANISSLGLNRASGVKHSKKSKEKISKTLKELYSEGNPNTKGKTAWNKGLKGVTKAWNKGLSWSNDMKQKFSKAHLGKTLSEEHKKAIGKAHLGKKRPKSVGEKISAKKSGKKHHMWKGFVVTPFGVFETPKKASEVLDVSLSGMYNRINSVNFPDWYRSKEVKNV